MTRSQTPPVAAPTEGPAIDAAEQPPAKPVDDPTTRRARILSAAVALAEEGGYEGVRARELCERAGVSMGTLYRSFESKEEILLTAFQEELGELEGRLRTTPIKGATPVDRADVFFRITTKAFAQRALYARALLAAMSTAHGKATSISVELTNRMMRAIHNAWVGAEQAEKEPDAPIHPIARMLGNVWFALMVGWSASIYTTDHVIQEMHDTVRLV